MRRFLLALLTALGLSAPAQAQHVYSQPELDSLLAPIALYPDALLSQVLIAAKYPDQIAAAAQLPRDAQPDESWDPNVKALLSFPEILSRMAGSPQWTHDLGEAFTRQEPHVMDTVQALRRRAQAGGQLKSNDQQIVSEEDRAIVVEPRRPNVVYAPYYDPYVVYGPWWWPGYYPVVWYPWAVAPVFISAGFFIARPVWAHRHVVVHNAHHGHVHHAGHGHGYIHRPAPVHQAKPVHQHPVNNKVVVRDYHRVPESKRQPIVQSGPRPQAQQRGQHRTQMPAAPRYSEARPTAPQQQHRPAGNAQPQQQHRPAGNAQPQREARGGGEVRSSAPRGGEMHGGGGASTPRVSGGWGGSGGRAHSGGGGGSRGGSGGGGGRGGRG